VPNGVTANGSPNYQQSLNYSVDKEIPRGCTVNTLPVPTNGSTRINIFSVTETVTGSNFNFQIAYCPFFTIDSTVTLVSPQALLGNLTILTAYYRGVSDIGNTGTPVALSVPHYNNRSFVQNFPSNGVTNVLDANTPLTFPRVNGLFAVIVTYGTSYFSFEVDAGIMRQDQAYIGLISPLYNAKLEGIPENCTVQNILLTPGVNNAVEKYVEFQVTDLSGRNYIFTFDPDPYKQILPTIQLVSGSPPFGAVSVNLRVATLYYGMI
jgi:hypothetical protein